MSTNIFNRKDNNKTKTTITTVVMLSTMLFFGAIAIAVSPIQQQQQQQAFAQEVSKEEATVSKETQKPEPEPVQPVEPEPQPQPQPTEPEPEVGHQVDQDLDCEDYDKTDFPASEADERYGLDPDGDGIACETEVAPNGTEVIVDPTPVQEAAEEETVVEVTVEANTLFADVIEHINHALKHLEQGNTPAALVEIDSAISLTLLIQAQQEEQEQAAQPEPPIPEPEPEPQVQPEPEPAVVEPEPQPEEESLLPISPPDTPGNVVQPEQVFGTTLQECIDEIINAGLLIIEANAEQETGMNVTQEQVEQAANNTGTTEEIAEVVGENLPELVSNQTTTEEVVEEEIVPVIEDNQPEVNQEIEEIIVEIEE